MKLIMVYALDSGFFDALLHYAQKILSPSTYKCRLCMLTSGALGTEKAWLAFIESLGVPVEFLHQDEIDTQDPLPAVYIVREGQRELLVDAAAINACHDLQSLIDLMRNRFDAAREPKAARKAS